MTKFPSARLFFLDAVVWTTPSVKSNPPVLRTRAVGFPRLCQWSSLRRSKERSNRKRGIKARQGKALACQVELPLPAMTHGMGTVDGMSCSICLHAVGENCASPIRLWCGHVLCVECCSNASEHGHRHCPLCRVPHLLDVKQLRRKNETFRSGYSNWRRGCSFGSRKEVSDVSGYAGWSLNLHLQPPACQAFHHPQAGLLYASSKEVVEEVKREAGAHHDGTNAAQSVPKTACDAHQGEYRVGRFLVKPFKEQGAGQTQHEGPTHFSSRVESALSNRTVATRLFMHLQPSDLKHLEDCSSLLRRLVRTSLIWQRLLDQTGFGDALVLPPGAAYHPGSLAKKVVLIEDKRAQALPSRIIEAVTNLVLERAGAERKQKEKEVPATTRCHYLGLDDRHSPEDFDHAMGHHSVQVEER